MADNKTRPTRASVDAYLASRAGPAQLADCKAIMAMFRRVTKQQPRMWGASMVGYGSQEYRTPAGRTGEMPLAAFAIRGRDLVVYMSAEGAKQKALLRKVGKHSHGRTCLYFRRLADLDQAVLEKIVIGSIAEAKQLHG